MFGMEYLMGIIKWAVQIGFAIITAIPITFAWNRIGGVYFSFVPEVWLNIPYWHLVGVILIVQFVGELINSLIPKIVTIDNSRNEK